MMMDIGTETLPGTQIRNAGRSLGSEALSILCRWITLTELTFRKSHIFDGVELHRARGEYQWCDVTDPLIRRLVSEARSSDTCDVSLADYFAHRL